MFMFQTPHSMCSNAHCNVGSVCGVAYIRRTTLTTQHTHTHTHYTYTHTLHTHTQTYTHTHTHTHTHTRTHTHTHTHTGWGDPHSIGVLLSSWPQTR